MHNKRRETFVRDHVGRHRNAINPKGAGLKIERDGRITYF